MDNPFDFGTTHHPSFKRSDTEHNVENIFSTKIASKIKAAVPNQVQRSNTFNMKPV